LTFDFWIYVLFGVWCLKFGILAEGDVHCDGEAMMPRYIKHIDKIKLADIIQCRVFG